MLLFALSVARQVPFRVRSPTAEKNVDADGR
jgi:hypothetical protein